MTNELLPDGNILRDALAPLMEGSATDGRVLRDAVNRPNGLKVPNGQYYLCDNGYINCPGFLAPYRSVRYHLDEWCEGSRAWQNAKELYNQRHTKARNVIKCTWGMMKWRWAVLRSTSFYPLRTQNRMILSCALLHNFIRREMEVDPAEAHVPDLDPNHRNLYADDEPVEDKFVESVGPNYEWSASRNNLINGRDIFMKIMAACGSNASSYQGKKVVTCRRMWTKPEEDVLVQSLKKIISTGWKANNGFCVGYLNVLQDKIMRAFPRTDLRANPHISSKMHSWKKQYNSLCTIFGGTGVGWNPTTKMIDNIDDAS
ncbi:hypothetical protein BUALT_Bualt18G0030100 [Buddleja alternifolia]|uniref:Myb/SANT-like domain-containing protein n=1 Tax=Buddleja alternifolia TaxID=168488 RepID=A0AAV6WCM4_9LAMI|nr:hypothetical protein BUALT_Bualt18G0030100 [Buddleja alternifolia]